MPEYYSSPSFPQINTLPIQLTPRQKTNVICMIFPHILIRMSSKRQSSVNPLSASKNDQNALEAHRDPSMKTAPYLTNPFPPRLVLCGQLTHKTRKLCHQACPQKNIGRKPFCRPRQHHRMPTVTQPQPKGITKHMVPLYSHRLAAQERCVGLGRKSTKEKKLHRGLHASCHDFPRERQTLVHRWLLTITGFLGGYSCIFGAECDVVHCAKYLIVTDLAHKLPTSPHHHVRGQNRVIWESFLEIFRGGKFGFEGLRDSVLVNIAVDDLRERQ